MKTFSEIRAYCEEHFRELQMWPSYFNRRYHEFLSYYELMPQKRFESALEIGCGIGYYTAFLATMSASAIGTDQGNSEISIHRGNLAKASQLIQGLGIKNAIVKEAVAERLPFPDACFDLVFSSHVFGYLKDQRKALSEIHRVLKPGGIHFCVVPSRATTLIRLIEHHFYLLNRVCYHGIGKRLTRATAASRIVSSRAVSVKRHWLLPQPQGAQERWIEEVRATSHRRWKMLWNEEPRLELLSQVTTQLSPTLPLGSIYFPRSAAKLYGISRKAELRLGQWRGLRALGLNSVLIAQKPLSFPFS